jgi:hypothetical protein
MPEFYLIYSRHIYDLSPRSRCSGHCGKTWYSFLHNALNHLPFLAQLKILCALNKQFKKNNSLRTLRKTSGLCGKMAINPSPPGAATDFHHCSLLQSKRRRLTPKYQVRRAVQD